MCALACAVIIAMAQMEVFASIDSRGMRTGYTAYSARVHVRIGGLSGFALRSSKSCASSNVVELARVEDNTVSRYVARRIHDQEVEVHRM